MSFRLLTFLLVCLPVIILSEASAQIKIGIILPMSGPLAEYGTAELHGIQLAQTDYPELFSNIKFVFEDSQYDPKVAISAFNKLRTVDQVSVIYDWGSATGLALAPVAEGRKFPLLSMSIDPAAAIGRSYVIRFGNYAGQYIEKLVPALRARGFKKIGVIKVELAYTNSMYDEMVRQFAAPGESVQLLNSVNPADTDFKSIVTKLKQTPIDALCVYLMSGQIRQFYRQFADQGLSIPTIGTDFFESTDEIAAAGRAMEGAIYPHNPVPMSFHERYAARFGNDSQIAYAVNGYDFAVLMGRTFGAMENSPSGNQVIESLRKLPAQEGLVGTYRFREGPKFGMFFDFPIVVKTIREGRVVELH